MLFQHFNFPDTFISEVLLQICIITFIMEQVQKAISQYPSFIQKFDLDPELGILIKPTRQVVSFNFSRLKEYVDLLMPLKTQQEISDLIKQFPDLEIKEKRNNVDMLILHSFMVFVLEKFLYLLKITNISSTGALLPKSIAMPLHIAASDLNMTYGFALGVQFNWVPLVQQMNYSSEQFGYKDFQMRVYLTENPKMQKLFVGGSVVAGYHMGKVIRLIYQINCIIQHAPIQENEVILRLKLIKKRIQNLIKEVQIVVDQFDAQFFKKDMSDVVRGFEGLIFQGIDEGKDKALSATIGSGGSDCSFQVFDKSFGIVYKGELAEGHKRLQTKMPKSYIDLIKHFEQKSLIREYCNNTLELRKAYNQTISQYGQFIFLHQTYIRKFLLGQSGNFKALQAQKIPEGRQGYQIGGFLSHESQVAAHLLNLQGKN